MQNYYRKHKLGGKGNIIEIDESIFVHQGNDTIWVLGMYERNTKEMRAFYVPDRSQNTLTQIILENCELGSTIYTDFWRGYNQLKLFYDHKVLNKQKKGYGTSEWIHTNGVEQMWALLKRQMSMYACAIFKSLQIYLDEAIWRIKYKSFPERIEWLI